MKELGANKREIRIPPEKPQKGPCQIGRKARDK